MTIFNACIRVIIFKMNLTYKNQNELDIPKYQTVTGRRTFKQRGIKIWNELDEELKLTANLKHFKFKLLLSGNE